MNISLKHLIILFFCGLFFIAGFLTIKDYGINWDEPVHYIRGQAFLRYFLTGKKDYKDLPKIKSLYPRVFSYVYPKDITYQDDKYFRRSIYQYDQEPYGYSYQFFIDSKGSHPPLNGVLASFFNFIFYQKLGIVGDIESYHLFILFICTIMIGITYFFVYTKYGFLAGTVSFFSLALYPLFLAESHFNIKDPVSASFYALTIYAFYTGVTKNKWKLIILAGVLGGFSLGTKLNAFFIAPTLLVWLVFLKWKEIIKKEWPFSKRLSLSIFISPIISVFIFFITYPTLWSNPINNFTEVMSYYKEIGYGTVYQPSGFITYLGLNTYAFQWIIYTTPVIILILSVVGILFVFRNGLGEKNRTSILIFTWFFLPVLRVSLPNAGIYGGLRQIMEFIPAMAMLSGIGALYLKSVLLTNMFKFFNKYRNKKNKNSISIIKKLTIVVVNLGIVLSFAPIFIKLISIHPNENVYFNPLIGGLSGAREKNFPDWGITLGSVYQQGVEWINKNAEPNSNVALVKGLLSNIPIIKFRKDISFHEQYYSGVDKKGEYIMEVVDSHWDTEVLKEKREYLISLKPVYKVKVDGVTILSIWKNDKYHVAK